jgi:carboxymethylenebutenolidase
MYETGRVQHRITSGHISIVADGHYLPAFWAHPETGSVYPGLVLLHDWMGLTAQTRAWVRRLAEIGFYVIAPDLYDGQVAHTPEQAQMLRDRLAEAGPPRIMAALEVLKTHHRCTGKIGVVGSQMGGELAFHVALYTNEFRAAVIFYARPDDYLLIAPANETPILAFYGDSDPAIPPAALHRLSQAMILSPASERLIIYPDVSSGFLDETSPDYHPQFAAKAWKKMVEFLCAYLEAEPGTPDVDRILDD